MAQGTTVLRNGIDTHAGSANPSANHADDRRAWVEANAAYLFLYFNRPFPLGATVVKATLRLYTRGAWNTTPTLTVRRLTERWGVNRLTWNNQPAAGTVLAQLTQSSAEDGDEWAIDVTNHMQAVSDGAVWFGFRVGTTDTTAKALYTGNGIADYRPSLEVTWSRAPQAPTSLVPSGSQAVSIPKPTLRFDFTDHLGSTQLQAVHVQIDPNGTWTAPAWDSQPVEATEPELDLGTTTYPGLTAGQETRWRVRVQDGSGLWSPWSDVHRFRRDNKGTLSIDNPGVAPNDFVSEWTPPIIWSLAGETQRAWQAFITPSDDRTHHLTDTGRTKGTDTSWTVPKGVLEDEEFYRVVVRIWDTKDRAHTPDDPPFTQAERVFQFREDPTVNPVTNLAVENLLPRPWVELTWDRATAADRYVIKRDGRVIESDVDPADALVSGTSYRWVDKDAAPFRRHTWKVQSVANGKTSGGPDVSLEVAQQGIWLTDIERDIDVFIQGNDEGTWAMGEEATTHFPMGGERGVRITQSLRGWEGAISGRLTDALGIDVDEWEQRMLRIKSRPGQVCVLSLGNEAFRVVVGNVVTHPTPSVPITKAVSFEFWQVGRLDYQPRL